MVVLGLCGGHDANWCIFKDGKLVGAFEKERFTRIRHDEGTIMDLVDLSLKKMNIDFDEVSLIATSEANFKGTDPGIMYVDKKLYSEPDEWVEMRAIYHGRQIPCFSIPHHLCHAAYSHYTSGNSESTVLTWDGGGDFYTENAYTSTSISTWKNRKVRHFERIGNSDLGSLWHIYSKVMFDNPFAAGKLMGLAAYGTDRLETQMQEYCMRPVRGMLHPAMSVKNCWPDEDLPPWRHVNNWQHPDAKDLAYAIQAVTMKAGMEIVQAAHEKASSARLCLSGGVALNGYMNTMIIKSKLFDRVHIPPSVHDGGLSIGAAMFTINQILDLRTAPISEQDLVFNGMEYSDTECAEALEKAGIAYEVCSREDILERTTKSISAGSVIAWYEGRSEHGPRALGHRSLLADPRYPEMKNRLNRTIKFREDFRPIAPVVLEEDMKLCTEDMKRSPYMMNIVKTTEAFQRENPSGVHYDGTARVQTVTADNPMGEILKRMKDAGIGYSLLNTSFNCREPIVETPMNAVHTFLAVPVDMLVLNGKFMVKRANEK